MRRILIATTLALVGCDPADAVPRDLPGPELCDALAQVCPVGTPECSDMHAACIAGSPCKACALASEVAGKACALVQVCESMHVPSQCDGVCAP